MSMCPKSGGWPIYVGVLFFYSPKCFNKFEFEISNDISFRRISAIICTQLALSLKGASYPFYHTREWQKEKYKLKKIYIQVR